MPFVGIVIQWNTPLPWIVLAVAVVAMSIFIALLQRSRVALPYYAKNYLLSKGENAFFQALKKSLPPGMVIAPKVRVADLIGCDSKAWRDGWGGRISQKHVDFVLVDARTTAIMLVIELDDRTHQRQDRQERDTFLDEAFAAAGVPILHVPAAVEYAERTLRTRIAQALKPPVASER